MDVVAATFAIGQAVPMGHLSIYYTLTWLTTTGYFWHISDVHLDKEYSEHGSTKYMCHDVAPLFWKDNKPPQTGKYGEYECDSPWTLVNSTIKAMQKLASDPDFIIWTGDNLMHQDSLDKKFTSWEEVYQVQLNLSRAMRTAFPSTKILPVFGNHDSVIPSALPPGRSHVYKSMLMKAGWGGYYSVFVRLRLRVIALNTILWTSTNPEIQDLDDPAGQFEWLEEILTDAQVKNYKVYIIGHVSPGYFYSHARSPDENRLKYSTTFNQRYVTLTRAYHDVIVGQFFGHRHLDTFMIVKDDHGNAVNSIFLTPSVTPWHLHGSKGPPFYGLVNPSIRLYNYDPANGMLKNYHHYFLDLAKANENYALRGQEAEWEKMYSFTDAYQVPDLTLQSLQTLFRKLLTQDEVFQRYYNFTLPAKYNSPCDDLCRKSHLCNIENATLKEYYECLKTKDKANNTFL